MMFGPLLVSPTYGLPQSESVGANSVLVARDNSWQAGLGFDCTLASGTEVWGDLGFGYSCKVDALVSGQDGVLCDSRNENAFLWPQVLSSLTPEQRGAIMDMVVPTICRIRSGLDG